MRSGRACLVAEDHVRYARAPARAIGEDDGGPRGPEAETNGCSNARASSSRHLAPAVLHETNNVLTVMAGVRQFMKSSSPLSEKIGR